MGELAPQRFPGIYRKPSGLETLTSITLRSMKPRKTCERNSRTSEGAPAKPIPELPAWKAFVVQFSRESATDAGIFAGRIEHLSSGRRARFNSPEELLIVLKQQLEEIGAASDVHESED